MKIREIMFLEEKEIKDNGYSNYFKVGEQFVSMIEIFENNTVKITFSDGVFSMYVGFRFIVSGISN